MKAHTLTLIQLLNSHKYTHTFIPSEDNDAIDLVIAPQHIPRTLRYYRWGRYMLGDGDVRYEQASNTGEHILGITHTHTQYWAPLGAVLYLQHTPDVLYSRAWGTSSISLSLLFTPLIPSALQLSFHRSFSLALHPSILTLKPTALPPPYPFHLATLHTHM